MKIKAVHIPHQNGELLATINENNQAVLYDYIGDARVLYLPRSVSYVDDDGSTVSYDVSSAIPDMSFENCCNVKVLVCGLKTHFRFGDFVFSHCKALHSIVLLSLHNREETSAEINEFSFVEENNIPKPLKKYRLFLGDEWEFYHHHELDLSNPGDPEYDKATDAHSDYLNCVCSFMDWLVEHLPILIMKEDVNPDMFIMFVKRYGYYDFKEWKDRGGKIYISFDEPFIYNAISLTHCIPKFNKNDWIRWNSKQRQDELANWINIVASFFSGNSV